MGIPELEKEYLASLDNFVVTMDRLATVYDQMAKRRATKSDAEIWKQIAHHAQIISDLIMELRKHEPPREGMR